MFNRRYLNWKTTIFIDPHIAIYLYKKYSINQKIKLVFYKKNCQKYQENGILINFQLIYKILLICERIVVVIY